MGGAHETFPPHILAYRRERNRAAGRIAHRFGANLSDAADPAGNSLCPGRRVDTVGRPWADKMKFSLGLLAPAGTPIRIIEQIAQATRAAVAEPAFRQILIDAGIESALDSSPEEFRRSLAGGVALRAPVVNALALKID